MKIKKVLTQQLNVLSLPEIRIEAKSNDMGLERKYSILGGVLYIDEKPVHHYFSKNMFFYEDGEEQGSIFLAHHGLTADVIIRKNGKTTLCKASSLLHYEMTYQAEGKEKKLDAAFGMGIDSSRKSYFYCGLKQNGEEIIPVPSGEEEQKNQGILSVSYDEKTRNLITNWKTDAYAILKDDKGQPVYPEFHILSIKMIFDSLYRTCEATVQEGEQHICSYEASEISVHDRGTTPECFQGDYRIAYRTEETDTVIELYDIDCIVEEDSSGSRKKYYYCGIKWNGETLIPVPETREERKSQNFLGMFKMGTGWMLHLDGIRVNEYLENQAGSKEKLYIHSITLSGSQGSIIENRSREVSYTAKGKLVVPNGLDEARKRFRQNAVISESLKGRCRELHMDKKPLTLEQLCGIRPPSVIISTQDEQGKIVETTFDGQQYCSYKTSELLMDLVNYYGGDISNSDKSMKFADIFGKTTAASLEAINQVSRNIITEIEEAEDPEHKLRKGYLPEFLRKLAPIILTSTLAKRTDAEIIKGFGGREKEDEALIKSRFYLSYIPEEVKDGDTSKKENDNKKQVLSSQTEYHHLTAIIDKYVYLSINPDLRDYLEDPTTNYEGQKENQTAREYWAERMYYNYVETIQLLHLNYAIDPAWVTNIIKVLGILDSGNHDIKDSINGTVLTDSDGNVFQSSYSLALYAKLADYNMIQMIDTFKGAEDYENYCKLLIALYGSFYDKFKNKEITIPKDVEEAMQKFLKESKEIFVQWSVLQAQELMQFMIAGGSMSSALLTYNPTVPAVSKFFSAVNILVGAASFGNIFMNWDNLTPFQKAESILSVLQAGFSIARNFVLWRTVNTIFDMAASPAERMNAFYRYQVGGGSFDTLESVSFHSGDSFDLKSNVEENATRYARKVNEGEYSTMTLEKSSRCFVVTEVIFQAFNVALMGIAFVAEIMELNKMFQNPGSYSDVEKALSVINTIFTGVAVVLGVAEFALGFTALSGSFAVATVLPIVNTVLMGAMFVISIVMLIIHKDPVAPITLLIQEKISGAVQGLAKPSQEWIDANTPKQCFLGA